jgi:DNA repair protein RAD5
MDIKKRNDAVSEFKSASRKPKVLIVSLKAGGVGLNVSSTLYYACVYSQAITADNG